MTDAAARLLAMLLAGCGPAEPVAAPGEGEEKAAAPAAAAESGAEAARVGSVVEIRLPAQLGAGYSWALASPAAPMLEPLESGVERAEPGVEGAAQVQVFRFRAAAPGRAELRFDYRRPWLADQPPRRSVTRVVEVAP